jgi:hypothetical protein
MPEVHFKHDELTNTVTVNAGADKYDDVLLPFLSLMRRELHANCGKGDRPGWLSMDAETALLEVYYHLAKLQKAVKQNDGPQIMEFSADVANMAMMVLDICGGLAFVDVGSTGKGDVLAAFRQTEPPQSD